MSNPEEKSKAPISILSLAYDIKHSFNSFSLGGSCLKNEIIILTIFVRAVSPMTEPHYDKIPFSPRRWLFHPLLHAGLIDVLFAFIACLIHVYCTCL